MNEKPSNRRRNGASAFDQFYAELINKRAENFLQDHRMIQDEKGNITWQFVPNRSDNQPVVISTRRKEFTKAAKRELELDKQYWIELCSEAYETYIITGIWVFPDCRITSYAKQTHPRSVNEAYNFPTLTKAFVSGLLPLEVIFKYPNIHRLLSFILFHIRNPETANNQLVIKKDLIPKSSNLKYLTLLV
jgi:hypothetical protein